MAKGPKDQAVSERLPVARVAVDISLAHLDRPFDYLVPARLDAAAVPGCRVRVRFAGQLVDGYLLERAETSEHQGRLARLERVISPEPVLTPEIFDLARAVADRYAGTLADVLRLAIPPRHATAEREAPQAGTPRDPAPKRPEPGSWSRYPAGPAFLAGLAGGRPVRAAWSALPGPEWPAEIAVAAATTAAAGRGVVIVVPDARDLDRVDAALTDGRPGSRLPHRGPRPGRALPALAGGPPRPGPGGGGHPGRDVRPGRRARPGGALGRRRRPARRAARAVPERPRGAGPARPPDRRGRADRRLRPHGRAHPAGRGRLGPAAGRQRRRRSGRRRPGSGPRRTRPNWPGTPRR